MNVSRDITRSNATPHRMPQLDGLRAIAVFLVFAQHWHWPFPAWITRTDMSGSVGVQMFFVLSGFLITGILLRCRRHVDQGKQTRAYSIRQFYARRFLRIFPLYYATLAVLTVAGFLGSLTAYDQVTKPLLWHVFYLTNFYIVHLGKTPSLIDHFWTLAVEEQFYLVWPWLIVFAPRRRLKWIILGAIAAAFIYRLIGLADAWPATAVTLPSPSVLNALAGGALLAYLLEQNEQVIATTRRWVDRLVFIGLPCMALGYWLGWPVHVGLAQAVLQGVGVPLTFAWLTMHAAEGFGGATGRFLEFAPIVYLGRISYGLYILHKPVPFAWSWVSRHLHGLPQWLFTTHSAGAFVLYSFTAVVAASASWFLFEQPINRLKYRFPYRKPQPAATPEQTIPTTA